MRPLVTAEARAAQDQKSHKVTGSPALFLGVFLSPCVPAAERDSSCGQLLSSSEEVRIEADGMVMMIQTQLPDTEPDRKKPGYYLVQRNDADTNTVSIRRGLAYEWTGRMIRCQVRAPPHGLRQVRVPPRYPSFLRSASGFTVGRVHQEELPLLLIRSINFRGALVSITHRPQRDFRAVVSIQ